MADIFFSYVRTERAKVWAIKDALADLGLDIFVDIGGIDAGIEFPDAINQALRTSKVVVACWSPLYFTRRWCVIESRVGAESGILLPVAVDKFTSEAIPADLRFTNHIDLSPELDGALLEENWTRLTDALAKRLSRALPRAALRRTDVATPLSVVLADLREQWGRLRDKGIDTLEEFLKTVRVVAPGSGLEIEVKRQLDRQIADTTRLEEEKKRSEVDARERLKREEIAKTKLLVKADLESDARLSRRRWKFPNVGRPTDRAKPGARWRDAVDGMPSSTLPEMVTLPRGGFKMGAPPGEEGSLDSERPIRDIRFGYTFAIGRFPVTVMQVATAYALGAPLHAIGLVDEWSKGHGNHPAGFMDEYEIERYVEWLNQKCGLTGAKDAYRLPSESEWEYACRAGTTGPFSFGSGVQPDQANYDCRQAYGAGKTATPRYATTPVDAYPSNRFGLHDMHGNFPELCSGGWTETLSAIPTNGEPAPGSIGSKRVVRGGRSDAPPSRIRSASRELAFFWGCDVGCRLARTISHS